MKTTRERFLSVGLLGAGVLAAAVIAVTPKPAEAWWRGGFYVGGPAFFVGPPVVYPPPVVYAPPPVVYTPPPPVVYTPPQAGYAPGPQSAAPSCVAGPYVCPLPPSYNGNGSCSCFDNAGRRIFGQAR